MIETNETGEKQIQELLKVQDDSIFNAWEQNFIRDLNGKSYEKLSKSQKACITRLINWYQSGLH